MDETHLRALLSQAVSAEPPAERPLGRIAADSRRGGGRLRRRRRTESAVASVASVAMVAVAVSFASGAFGHTHNQGPAYHFGGSGQTAYVLTTLGPDHGRGAVVPVNLATLKAGHPIQNGLKGILTYSNDIIEASGGRTLYVSTSGGVILPISTATGKIGRHIRVPGWSYADELVSTPNGEIAYAAGHNGSITPIDLMTGTALRQISVPTWDEVAVSRNSATLLTVGAGPHDATTVATVVNLASGRVQKPISFRGHPNTMCAAVSPEGGTGYLVAAMPGPIVVVPIDVAANKPLRAIKLRKEANGPDCSMAIASNGRTGYVLVGRYVTPIDLVTGRALKPIKLSSEPTAPASGFEIAIDPDGRMAYALQLSNVTPIDLATNTALPPISFGHGAYCMAFSPNGKTVLVGIGGPGPLNSGMLLPIQAATGKAGKAIRMPSIPASIVVTP
jgi:hypothetical protein